MGSVRELTLRHHEALRADAKPTPGPPVLIEAAGLDEVLLPKSEERTPTNWRTQVIQVDPDTIKKLDRERVERMLALQDLVLDTAQVLPLVKAGQNPSPHVCLGRAKRNDIIIADPTVSSLHAFFEGEGETFSLSDQGSKNGTFVNRRKLEAGVSVRLCSGDCLRFGQRAFYYLSGERLLLFLELRIVRPRSA